MISKTAIIFPNVKLGKNCMVEDYAIIGQPPVGHKPGQLKTVIGDDAVIRSHTVIYAGNRIGHRFSTGNKTNIRELNNIGNNVSIGTLSVVEHHVNIKNGVRIHTQAFIPEFSILEYGCWIGPNTVFTNVFHPLCAKAKKCIKGPVIRKRAKIGANVTILPGVIVGESALVGAGSVVTKDVPPRSVVRGNPAMVIKDIGSLKCPYKMIKRPYR